jgi:hypothetical protein
VPRGEAIKISGLREFQAGLRKMSADLPKQLRLVFNDAAALVVDYATPRVPARTGRARGSIKVRSSQRLARIAVGGRRAPYYPWLDFGGRTGPRKSVVRPFRTEGRYIYPGLAANREEITDVMNRGLVELARGAGVEVD